MAEMSYTHFGKIHPKGMLQLHLKIMDMTVKITCTKSPAIVILASESQVKSILLIIKYYTSDYNHK